MGFLHLSFEYHANKSSVKVRVWQVSDLLLPPPQVSMIHSIFVRSYLIPDPPQKTVRRTEEVRVWEPELKVRDPVTTVTGVSHQHIFTPSSFKFSTPLIYTGVTPTIVKERSVQIEVMMTQRGSKRHFLIGMVHMPLKYAVKKLIREEFPLIPCMNHTIPSTMRVYSAHDLQLESSLTGHRPSRSFRFSSSSSSGSEHSQDAVCNGVDEVVEICNGDRWSPGCSSAGGELEEVVSASNRCRDFVSLSLGGSPRDRGEGGDLTEVTVSSNSLASDSSSITVNSGEELSSSQQSDGLKEVRVVSNDSPCHVVEINEPKRSASENVSPSSPRRSAFRSTKEPKSPQQLRSRMPMDEEARLERPIPKHLNIQRLSEGSDGSTDRELPLISPASSRPETPCWDYYDLEEEVEDEDDIPHPLVLDPSLSLEAVRAMTSDHIPPHLHPTLVLGDEQEAENPVV